MKKVSAGWGKNAYLVVLTTSIANSVVEYWKDLPAQEYLLVYDSESNEFALDGAAKLIAAVKGEEVRLM